MGISAVWKGALKYAGSLSAAGGSAADVPAGARPAGFFRRNPSVFYFVGQTSSIQNSWPPTLNPLMGPCSTTSPRMLPTCCTAVTVT